MTDLEVSLYEALWLRFLVGRLEIALTKAGIDAERIEMQATLDYGSQHPLAVASRLKYEAAGVVWSEVQ